VRLSIVDCLYWNIAQVVFLSFFLSLSCIESPLLYEDQQLNCVTNKRVQHKHRIFWTWQHLFDVASQPAQIKASVFEMAGQPKQSTAIRPWQCATAIPAPDTTPISALTAMALADKRRKSA